MVDSGIRAIDIMTTEIVIAYPEMNIVEVSELMNRFRIGGIPVVNNGLLVGIVTERDIMRKVIAVNLQPSAVKVGDVMTSPPIAIAHVHDDLSILADKMSKFDITRLPILDHKGRLAGIVTNRDVLKNSSEFMETLLEQSRIKGETREEKTAFGKCELCGDQTYLYLKKAKFLCEECGKPAIFKKFKFLKI
ncbi:MAG: CBS domain-containing protein [DPANN group archaeon]|nr:CBS domain-containing protein [DPANN group archaeon]